MNMQMIKMGSTGDFVERWQNFLTGFYPDIRSKLRADGIFGQQTLEATIRFQKQFKLSQDGIVGNTTIGVAMSKGFPVILDADEDKTGPSWPPAPSGWKPVSEIVRQQMFGKFEYEPAPSEDNPEGIRILGGWESTNVISVTVPQFSKVPGSPKSNSCRINKVCSKQFLKIWSDWEAAGLLDRVLSWNGSFVPRFIRGSTERLSNHSFGSAFDINVKWNLLGSQPALVGEKGSVRELVMIAYNNGFSWGGWYKNRPDGMHFECYTLI